MIDNIYTNTPWTQNPNFVSKAVKFKEITGREIVIEKDKYGEFIHMLHPESTQRVSFFMDFFRMGFNQPAANQSENSHETSFAATIESLAKRYADLRDELVQRYGDDEYELYKQFGELNSAFERALQSTALLPQQPMPSTAIISSQMPRSVQESIRREWQEFETVNGFLQTLGQNIARHLDVFFETFIKSIQSGDFELAFTNSMDVLNRNESTSLANLSFRDTVFIRDTLSRGHIRDDAERGELFTQNRPSSSLFLVTRDERIAENVRRELAELLGFSWRG